MSGATDDFDVRVRPPATYERKFSELNALLEAAEEYLVEQFAGTGGPAVVVELPKFPGVDELDAVVSFEKRNGRWGLHVAYEYLIEDEPPQCVLNASVTLRARCAAALDELARRLTARRAEVPRYIDIGIERAHAFLTERGRLP